MPIFILTDGRRVEWLSSLYMKQRQIVNITPFFFKRSDERKQNVKIICKPWHTRGFQLPVPGTMARRCAATASTQRLHSGRTVQSRAEQAQHPLMVHCVTCGTLLHSYSGNAASAARRSPPPRHHYGAGALLQRLRW